MAHECAVAKMAQAGKYLSFKLDNDEYGLEILKVQEIVGTAGISPFPRPTDNVRGSLSLRGREVPIFWMRDLFGLESWQENEKNCVIIAEVLVSGSPVTIGLVVDEVCEVLNIASEEIHFPPSWAGGMEELDFISGLGQLTDRDVILLEIENFFSEEELKAVAVFDE